VNLLDGVVSGKNFVDLGKFKIPVDTNNATGNVVVGIRPEDIAISSQPIPGAVEFSAYSVLPSGADSTIIARQGEVELTIKVMGITKIKMDEKIWLLFDPQTLNLYDKASENLIVSNN
jgi:multiple sugar transport system ATP-binding protein